MRVEFRGISRKTPVEKWISLKWGPLSPRDSYGRCVRLTCTVRILCKHNKNTEKTLVFYVNVYVFVYICACVHLVYMWYMCACELCVFVCVSLFGLCECLRLFSVHFCVFAQDSTDHGNRTQCPYKLRGERYPHFREINPSFFVDIFLETPVNRYSCFPFIMQE